MFSVCHVHKVSVELAPSIKIQVSHTLTEGDGYLLSLVYVFLIRLKKNFMKITTVQFVTVLILSECYNPVPQLGWHINNRNLMALTGNS